ncbi:hypothetical protein [Mucilaginibacter terrae]|uniref:Uncharacterized protein n=1 Tax=Mucilaginibacter terrae TaxID=1955052 RepID=A0ABU3GVU3_9SPHI|nr:hypothetical protein [Mucilaginibacter terrae]MDT3403883.1 hypothetical protein [Mucilaginibacter terrae]
MKEFVLFFMDYIVPGSTLLPLGAGLLYYKQLNKPLRTLLLYLAMAFTLNVIGTVLANYGVNNLPGLHLYTICEVVLLMLYFKAAFDNAKADKIINIILWAFPLLCIINFSFFQSLYEFNTYTRPLGALIVIVASILYLAVQSDFKKPELITVSGRIVASGFLIYFCSSLFQFIFSNVLSHHVAKEVRKIIWEIHACLVIIMYLFFLAAILNERRKRQY